MQVFVLLKTNRVNTFGVGVFHILTLFKMSRTIKRSKSIRNKIFEHWVHIKQLLIYITHHEQNNKEWDSLSSIVVYIS